MLNSNVKMNLRKLFGKRLSFKIKIQEGRATHQNI